MIPKLMGILNVTPNSFSDGGLNFSKEDAVRSAMQMIENGASYIDIGGESTRPGAEPITSQEELRRTISVVKEIAKLSPDTKISIDTTKYEVAKQALDAGATMINDISGLTLEPRFVELAVEYAAELTIMHIQGTPRDMQLNPHYNDVVDEVYTHLAKQATLAKSVSSVYVDVGIGFGKTLEHNVELIRNIERFNNITGKQVLGISRKSFIKGLLGIENPLERDMPTAMLHYMLLSKNIEIIRVHNVSMISDMIKLYNAVS